MDYIKKINDYISEVKQRENNLVDKKINSFYDVNCKSVIEINNVDINYLIKNIITVYLCNLDDERFNIAIEKLNKMDFNYLYDKYCNFNFLTATDTFNELIDEDGKFCPSEEKNAEISNYTLGIDFEKPIETVKGLFREFDKVRKKASKNQPKNSPKSYQEVKKDLFDKDFLCEFMPELNDNYDELLERIYHVVSEKNFYNDLDNLVKKEISAVNKPLKLYIEYSNKKCNILSFIKQVNYNINCLYNDKESFDRTKLSLINRLEKLKIYINNLNDDISNIDKIDFNLLFNIDKEMYLHIFENLFLHQKNEYDRVYKEYEKNKEIYDSDYLYKMFSKFNIDYNSLSNDIKLFLASIQSLDNLNKNMQLLKIDNNDEITIELIKYLAETPYKILKEYTYYINCNIISKKLLLNNLNNNNIVSNCNIVQENNLSFSNKLYSDLILLKDNSELSLNNKLLSFYKRVKGNSNFNYLNDSYNFDLLDILIENGININLLDENVLSKTEIENFIKRIYICLSLNIPIYTKSGNINRSFLLGNNFYAQDDSLDDYILKSRYENEELNNYIKNNLRNEISYDINIIEEYKRLETFKSEDELYYDIDGIIISRPKVMRNLTLFHNNNLINKDSILTSIIYNSYLSDEEIKLIEKRIFSKVKRKNK